MVNVDDLAITSLETISAFDIESKDYLFTLDELQDSTIAQTQEKADVTGKGGRKLTSLKKNKAVTISGNNGLISGGLLELQTGGKFESKTATTVQWSEELTISSNTAKTTYTAYDATSGNEIQNLYIKNSNGVLEEELEQGDTAANKTASAKGKFTYTPDTKTLTFNAAYEGKTVYVIYKRQIAGSVLTNLGDRYSQKAELYVDAFAESKCGTQYHVQFHIPKADFNGEFSIELGGDQAVHAFEAEALTGACGTKGELWTYTVFGVDANEPEE